MEFVIYLPFCKASSGYSLFYHTMETCTKLNGLFVVFYVGAKATLLVY